MHDPDRQIWDSMLTHLRATYPAICRQWFEELEPLGIASGALQLRARSNIHRDYLARQCADAFNEAARTVSGHLLSVRFLGPDDQAEKPPPARRSERRTGATTALQPPQPVEVLPPIPLQVDDTGRRTLTPQSANGGTHTPIAPPRVQKTDAHRRYEPLVINPDYSFEHFVRGPGNELALMAAQAVAASPGRAYNPYFIHGGVGLGKTHLLQAICLRIAENSPRAVIYYISCERFRSQFLESVQSGEMADFRHRFRDVDVLVVDDIHFLARNDLSQEEFFHTFNELFQAGKQIVLSSDAPPEDIPDLEERLVSRFKCGLVCKIEPPDYETRVQIVQAKARLRGLSMPIEVAEFIAQRLTANIRELEGAVVKLQIQSVVENRPLDLALARSALGESIPQTAGEPTLQGVIAVVTEYYDCRLADLQGKHRQRSIALPRQVCMYLARKCTRHSLQEIGGFFGGRDHTTVMHAVRAIETRLAATPAFREVLQSLEKRVRGDK
jgi:chromosomal replication initiator protein